MSHVNVPRQTCCILRRTYTHGHMRIHTAHTSPCTAVWRRVPNLQHRLPPLDRIRCRRGIHFRAGDQPHSPPPLLFHIILSTSSPSRCNSHHCHYCDHHSNQHRYDHLCTYNLQTQTCIHAPSWELCGSCDWYVPFHTRLNHLDFVLCRRPWLST